MSTKYDVDGLRQFASNVLEKSGLPAATATIVADGLLEADLIGHTTHGLGLLGEYVEEIEGGILKCEGTPLVREDFGAVANWDAQYLPGIWTTTLAVDEACARAEKFGVGVVSVAQSHHIGCLAVFVEAPARNQFATIVMCSDPSDALVAPSGGITPVLTPNPIAAGIPADPDPIIMDISTSITTAGQCARSKREGLPVTGPWLVGADGAPTNEPKALDEGGALLPLGGMDHGHKGFALGLMVDTLTQGLSGYSRASEPETWGAAVLVMAFSPKLFGRSDHFVRDVTDIINRCRASKPIDADESVRIPGERALAYKREAKASGVVLHPNVAISLEALSERLSVSLPIPLSS